MKTLTVLVASLLLMVACGGDKGASQATAGTPGAPKTSTADAIAALPEADRAPFSALMASYDTIHAALSHDKTDGVAAAASAIQTSAGALESTAPEASKPLYKAVAESAAKLAADAGEITAARNGFGELNRSMMTLLVANPNLAKGRVILECPMTKTYKKWLQTQESVENPYYGGAMLTCGVKSDLKV